MGLMTLLFRFTKVGLHMRAVADNATSATLAAGRACRP